MNRRYERICSEIEGLIRKRILYGASFAFVYEGQAWERYSGVQGAFEPYAGRPLEQGMIYDLASLTKVVGTAMRVLQIVETGRLLLDTPVSGILKKFSCPEITVGNLLLHNSGLPADIPGKEGLSRESMIERLYEIRPAADCGQRLIYSDPGYILLGLLVQELDRMTLEESFRRNVFGPLSMKDTTYRTDKEKRLYIPTECRKDRGCVCGQVHDSKAYLLGQSGSAGLFSTLPDLVRFVNAYLEDEELLLNKETYRLIREKNENGRTYGWSKEYGEHTLYHTGFTGTSILMNLDRKEGMILLSNRIHPTRDNQDFIIERDKLNHIFLGSLS